MFPVKWYDLNHSESPPNLNPLNLLFSSPPDSLFCFSDSIDLLAATVSNTSVTGDSRAAHLDSTISLLDTCNSISAQIERLRLGCLKLKFALYHLSSPSSDHLSCARKVLSGWEFLSSDEASDLGLESVEEIERANSAVRRLNEVINGGEIAEEELRVAVGETEKMTEELKAGLDRLAGAVSRLFSAVLHSRNAVLDSYKVGPKRCK